MTRFEVYIRDNYRYFNRFASKLGVSSACITNWMNGSSFPCPYHIRKIHELTKGEIDPNYLLLEFPRK